MAKVTKKASKKTKYDLNPIDVANKFVEENRGKKILCLNAGDFAEHLLINSSFKELDIIFLDDERKKGLCGKVVLYLEILPYTGIKYDMCIWTILSPYKELRERYKSLNPVEIF